MNFWLLSLVGISQCGNRYPHSGIHQGKRGCLQRGSGGNNIIHQQGMTAGFGELLTR
jgi:hypothetical protein